MKVGRLMDLLENMDLTADVIVEGYDCDMDIKGIEFNDDDGVMIIKVLEDEEEEEDDNVAESFVDMSGMAGAGDDGEEFIDPTEDAESLEEFDPAQLEALNNASRPVCCGLERPDQPGIKTL